MTAEQTVAWEAERRSRVTIATGAAALFLAIGAVLRIAGLRPPNADDRIVTMLDALRATAAGDAVAPGRLSSHVAYLGDHAVTPAVGAIFTALGTLLIFPALAFLFRATRARRPAMPQVALVSAAVGAVAFAIGHAVAMVATSVGASQFVDQADQSNSAAHDAINSGAVVTGQLIEQIGALALAVAFILIAMNAMRVGLLARFMGIIGVIVGVTYVIPLDQPGVLKIIWLVSLAMLFAGRVRNVPPAWASGNAEPWPTQQQLREEREAARVGAAGERAAPAVATQEEPGATPQDEPGAAPRDEPEALPAPTAPTPRAGSSGSRRKRKRRS